MLVKFEDNQKFYYLAPQKIKVGDYVQNGSSSEIKIGNCLPLQDIPVGIDIHNVEIQPGAGGKIARAAGSSVTISGIDGNYSIIKMTSGEVRKIDSRALATIGVLSNPDQKNIKIDLFNSKLRSPIDGFILGINTRVGERPQNEGILDIGSSQKMEALIEVYESDIDRVFISQNVELTSENGGFQKNLKGKVIRISPQVKQRKVLSTDPTGDADSRIVEVLVKLDKESVEIVQNYAGMKVIAKFIP